MLMNDGLATRLHLVVWMMDRKADDFLKREYGFSLSWGRLLIMLETSSPLTQHDLAQRLNHSDPAISRQLERMSDSGLVTVTVDPGHRRKRLVDLTTHGRALVAEANRTLEGLFRADLTRAGIDIGSFGASIDTLANQLCVGAQGETAAPRTAQAAKSRNAASS
jgi:DNA-binding MarR family transcriptional regulator